MLLQCDPYFKIPAIDLEFERALQGGPQKHSGLRSPGPPNPSPENVKVRQLPKHFDKIL